MAENDEIAGWFAGRLPQGWSVAAPEVEVDRDELYVIVALHEPELEAGAGPEAQKAARGGAIKRHREETREARIAIAEEAQKKFGRVVSWGAKCGEARELFTHLGLPVMTRLRLPERQLLDALVDSGVARSRSHALAWCVRMVERNQGEWVKELKEAVKQVESVRRSGPMH